MELPGKGFTVYLIFSLQRLSVQTYLKHAWGIKCTFVCKSFSNFQAALPLSTAASIFIFSNTISLIFGRVDGNVTINPNICFFKAISLHLTQVHIFCISDLINVYTVKRGPTNMNTIT